MRGGDRDHRGTAGLYRDRYPEFPSERVRVIPNGFDEAAFPAAAEPRHAPSAGGPCVFLHSGNLYPVRAQSGVLLPGRRRAARRGRITPETVRFDLRGGGYADRYQPQLERLGIGELVRLLPGLPYRDALAEMRAADVLMLFQAANCNRQIPAKLYEYLYVGRPVVGFTDPAGDTGRLLTELGIEAVAPLDDVAAIKA